MATKYKYDKNTDYAALMEQAAQRGDHASAAIYEQQRNAKIRGEGMTDQEQTNDYAQYLPLEDVPDYDDTHRREAESLLTERDTTAQRSRIDQMLDALLGEEFNYDPASDQLYAAYRQQYERQADLAAANALGAAAALTGGACFREQRGRLGESVTELKQDWKCLGFSDRVKLLLIERFPIAYRSCIRLLQLLGRT